MKSKKLLFAVFPISILFFSSAITFAQVPTNGLVGFWPFNGNANDLSGNNHNGTVNGASLTSDRFGNDNGAYSFNGTSNNIVVADDSNFSFVNNQFTISFWIYANPNPTLNYAILGKRGSSTSEFEYVIRKIPANDANYGNKCIMNTWNLAGSSYPYPFTSSNFTADDTISTQQWENWTLTADGNAMKAYKNGVEKYTLSRNTSSSLGDGTGSLTIGSGGGYQATYYMNGKLDDIRIYNRALDSLEVSAIANETFCTVTDTIHIAVTDTLVINANLTGVNPPNNQNTIKIFPNPTNDHITINTGNFSLMNGYQIKIINTLSLVVYDQTINAPSYYVDLNTFTGMGTYFVQIFDSQSNLIDVRKIILQ